MEDRIPGALGWSVVVPFKGGPAAKSRLGLDTAQHAGLPPAPRRQLALAFLRDTVMAVAALKDVRRIIVVSSDQAATTALPGVMVVADPGNGLNAAISFGIECARSRDAGSPVAVLTGDLPCLRKGDLEAALELARAVPLGVVPDCQGTGSTLVTALPGMRVVPRFGVGSFQAHRHGGHVILPVAADSTVRQDVDTVADLDRALQRGAGISTELTVATQYSWYRAGTAGAGGRPTAASSGCLTGQSRSPR